MMFELNVEQEVKSGHLAIQGKDIPGSEKRITLKPYTNRPLFQILFPYIVFSGHAISWCCSKRTESSNSHSILRAFASIAPSAWNDLPSDTCKSGFLTYFKTLFECHLLGEDLLDYPILNWHPPTPLYFFHSTYYYLT